jgi:hypothetical protein
MAGLNAHTTNLVTVFVPYTQVQSATQAYLADNTVEPLGLDVQYADVSEHCWAHTDYFQARWDEGRPFVNMEHDIVPWPGAISEMWECDGQWCFYGYLPEVDCVKNGCAPFGLVKFTDKFISATPDVWREMRHEFAGNEFAWAMCDVWLYRYAEDRGIKPHQHLPSVFNPSSSGWDRIHRNPRES